MPKKKEPRLCASCGDPMLLAKRLKRYPKSGPESGRRTCPLHGPFGPFRHLGGDR